MRGGTDERSPSEEEEVIECKQFLKREDDENVEADSNSGPKEAEWESQLEYLLALIGYTVGVSAMWRFPIVCARNGGGAFLIPYILLMGLIGAPLYYLEICLGQFCGKGPWRSYEFCPLFKGVGLLMVTMSALVVWYYQVIMAWILYYLYNSFSSTLAWTSCDNEWNTDRCTELETSSTQFPKNHSQGFNHSSVNETVSYTAVSSGNLSSANVSSTSAATEFWFHNVLRQSPHLDGIGSIQPHLLVCLILTWVLINICLMRGVKSIGKVVYVTALFPYVLLTVLMVRGVTLDGAGEGILFYITPKFHKILEPQVWLDAALQVFYSLGPMWGGIITMAAYNKFDKPVLRDSIIVCSMDLFTALYAGIVVFSVVGYMSKISGVPIEEMAISSGHGLAFIVYPTAASLLPSPQLWSALFFLSMLLVILDSLFTMAEVAFLCVIEFIPRWLGKRRLLVNIVLSVVFLLAGLVFITNGGIYLFHIFDWYLSSFGLLVGAAFESFMIGNIYGAERFSRDIEVMTGRQLSKAFRILICVIIPILSVIIFLVTISDLRAPTHADGTLYPSIYIITAIVLGLVPLAVMFGIGVSEVISAEGSIKQRLLSKLSPSNLWVPKDRRTAAIYKSNPYRYEATLGRRWMRNIWGSKHTPCI